MHKFPFNMILNTFCNNKKIKRNNCLLCGVDATIAGVLIAISAHSCSLQLIISKLSLYYKVVYSQSIAGKG